MDKYRPHVSGPYYSGRDEKQRFLRDIFDRTAPYYERVATWGWFFTGDRYRRDALKRAGVQPHMRAIDVASGTGPVARALLSILDSPDQVVCVEPSAGMIAESKKTVPSVHHQSTAEALPVEDQSFDILTMGFALRHVDDLRTAFAEFHRVLKPGGTALILDVTVPEGRVGRFFFRAYFKYILPGLSFAFTWNRDTFRLMYYYWETMEQMTPRDEITRILSEAGFSKVEHRVVLGCFSEYEARR